MPCWYVPHLGVGKMELAGAERERVTDFLATRRGNSQDAMRGWGPPAGLGRTLRGAARLARREMRARADASPSAGGRAPRRPRARAPCPHPAGRRSALGGSRDTRRERGK